MQAGKLNRMRQPFSRQKLNARTVRIVGREVGFADVFNAWAHDPDSAHVFNELLADMPGTSFRWELPALDRSRLRLPFECVVVNSPELDIPAEPQPFAGDFERAGQRSVICFANLGGDAELIVPCPIGPDEHYSHMASFVRRAPAEQQQALWEMVGRTMLERLGDQPLWLSTAGGGVAWLHVRLDSRPKYYVHAPYRRLA